jgi:hypothetical protein
MINIAEILRIGLQHRRDVRQSTAPFALLGPPRNCPVLAPRPWAEWAPLIC